MKGTLLALFGTFALVNNVSFEYTVHQICANENSDGKLVEHRDCDKFYICSEGKPVTFNCPINPILYFDAELKLCNWPTKVICGSREIKIEKKTAEQIHDDPSKAAEICIADRSEGTLIAHPACDKFYICSQGLPVAQQCLQNPLLRYNPKTEACDWPLNVDCGTRTMRVIDETDIDPNQQEPFQIHDDPSKAADICAAEESEGVLVAHEECAKFYICHDGQPKVLQCIKDPLLYFNPKTNYCDGPENVECGSRIEKFDDMDEKTKEGEGGEKDIQSLKGASNEYEAAAVRVCTADSDGTVLPHGDCDKFYECSKGLPVTFQCLAYPILLYNTEYKYCDWAKNVDCGDRKKP